MEAKELSIASPPPASKDGLPADDPVIALAKEAASHFQSKRFAECADVLDQILKTKSDDLSVRHNIAVVSYLNDGGIDPKKLLDKLDKLKLNSASGGNNESSAVSDSKGIINNYQQLSAARSTYEDDFDMSIATVNKAIIMYHLRRYTHAGILLEPLYQNLEPIDESTALEVCLILLDAALASQNSSIAADVILYLERAFGVGSNSINQVETGTIAHHVSSPVSKVSANSSVLTGPDASVPLTNANVNTSENTTAANDDSIEYEKLMSTLGNSSENPEHISSSEISKITMGSLSDASDLKLELQLFKVRFLLLTQNTKAAKREIKHAMNMARGKDSSIALLLKAQVEFARGNFRKAIILLTTGSNKPEVGPICMFNNLGCVYHRLGDHALSLLYYTKALKGSHTLLSEKKLNSFSQDKSTFIFYNCALQYLACENPLLAAKCLHKASAALSSRPVLWLRLAECCIMASQKGLLQPTNDFGGDEAKIAVVGYGNCRRLLLKTKSANRALDSLAQDGVIGNDPRCRLSLPFARQCLWTALCLLNQHEANSSGTTSVVTEYEQDDSSEAGSVIIKNANNKTAPATDGKASQTATSVVSINTDTKEMKGNANPTALLLHSSIYVHEEMLSEENRMMKQAILADLSYVELCLDNPLKALRAAEMLREVPGCSKLYVFLSCVYGAEALCHLNRLKDAAELLSLYLSDNSTVDLHYWDAREKCSKKSGDIEATIQNASGEQNFQFLKPEEARGLVYVAFATMNAIKGDLKQAVLFVTKALSVIPNNPRALLAAVYLDILLGKGHDALAKLKRCSHVRFYRGSVMTLEQQ